MSSSTSTTDWLIKSYHLWNVQINVLDVDSSPLFMLKQVLVCSFYINPECGCFLFCLATREQALTALKNLAADINRNESLLAYISFPHRKEEPGQPEKLYLSFFTPLAEKNQKQEQTNIFFR